MSVATDPLADLCAQDAPPTLDPDFLEGGARLLARGLDAPLRPGQQVGDFQVEDVLGRGGQGVVYRVRRQADGQRFALKVPRRDVLPRLEREAQILFQLEHPEIIRIVQAHPQAVIPHIVTELATGGSLADRLRQAPDGLPLAEVVAVARAVLRALDCAHGRGVVHRDIKPSNILFSDDGSAKVADFGIGSLQTGMGSLLQSLTWAGTTRGVGTPLYMAPEQLYRSGRVDGRADLFALGKVLYQALTGYVPRTLRPVSRLRHEAIPAWDDFIFGLVEEAPEDRPSSAAAALRLLEGLWGRQAAARQAAAVLSAGKTDVGRVRKANEDALGCWPLSPTEASPDRLFVVCDGVGGHVGGARASRRAVKSVIENLASSEVSGPALVTALVEAHHDVRRLAQAQPELRGLGSTCVALLLSGRHGWVAHVGDSRLYRVRAGKIQRMTRDHSLVACLVDDGIISVEQAARHPDRNVILQCLGSERPIEVELRPLDVCEGDAWVLCSDGICGPLRDAEILAAVLAHEDDPEAACAALIAAANDRGGEDNATVQVVRVRRIPGTPAAKSAAGEQAAVVTPAAGGRPAWLTLLLLPLLLGPLAEALLALLQPAGRLPLRLLGAGALSLMLTGLLAGASGLWRWGVGWTGRRSPAWLALSVVAAQLLFAGLRGLC